MFKEVKKNFGFGCMRLPMKENEVDIDQVKDMVDLFLAQGFNYFDTAHGYIQGKSELAIKEALTKRYPRDSYILTNKLTDNCFQTEEDIRPFFESQLELCGVSYFDRAAQILIFSFHGSFSPLIWLSSAFWFFSRFFYPCLLLGFSVPGFSYVT